MDDAHTRRIVREELAAHPAEVDRTEGRGDRIERIRKAAQARMDEMTGRSPYGGPQEFRLTTAEVAKFVALMDAYQEPE